MNRHRAYFPLDDAPASDGDGALLGVNARLDAALLPPQEVSGGINVRFDEGRAATRPGVRIMNWGAVVDPDQPDRVAPYGDVRVAESFLDPFGDEWQIIVTATGSWRTRPGTSGSPVPVAPGEGLAAAVDLIQTFNGMVMLRGEDLDPLYLRDLSEGWRPIPSPGEGLTAIPPAIQGIYFQNRLFVVDARTDPQYLDTVWVSNLGGVASVLEGDEVFQSFRINQGSSDRLRAVAKFNETSLIAAKERSIYAVRNIYGDNETLAQNAQLVEVTRQYGCIAPRSFVQVGKDLWFLAHRRGVASLVQTETNALQGVDVPVSRDLQPIIERINWEHAAGAVAAAHENRVYFAVPLDQSTRNNAVLVYSTLNQRWCGYDTGAAIKVRDWIKFSYGGAIRLGFLSTDGFVCLYEDGYEDQVGDAQGNLSAVPIASQIITRGYLGGVAGNKRFGRMTCRVATWNAAYTVTALADGVGEDRAVLTVDTSNTRYLRPYPKADWDPTNPEGDWDTPWREDYSVCPVDMQLTDADGNGTVAFGVLQDAEHVLRLPRISAHHLRFRFDSTRGRLEVAGIKVDASRGSSVSKTHA